MGTRASATQAIGCAVVSLAVNAADSKHAFGLGSGSGSDLHIQYIDELRDNDPKYEFVYYARWVVQTSFTHTDAKICALESRMIAPPGVAVSLWHMMKRFSLFLLLFHIRTLFFSLEFVVRWIDE